MSYGALQEAKERVRQATDIVDLVGSYLELRRQGRNYLARCPWHDDRRPSLNVNPERQSWRCWVCNIGGDVFEFVMQKERVDFRQALEMLAERAGIRLEPRGPTAAPGSADDKQTLYQAMAWAEKLYTQNLLEASDAAAARAYLVERGITAESVRTFRLGFAPDSWRWLTDRARGTSFTPEILEACGLTGRTSSNQPYDRFRARVLFPIHDLQGRPIAFGGRVLPGSQEPAKYVNSPETRLFSKSDSLYALNLAREAVAKDRSMVVVEGYTDVVLAHQCGMRNVVAVLGTAINQRHLRLLRRFVETIYLVLDGDAAGQRRTNEVLELFVAEQLDLRIMTLPEGLDPADFFLQRGAAEFRELLAGAVDALDHRIRVSTRGVNLTFDTHRANAALEEILTTIAHTPRDLSAASSMLREQQILTRLARAFALDEDVVRQRVRQLRSQRKTATVAADEPPPSVDGPPILLRSLPPDEVELLEILVLHPELAPSAFPRVTPEDVNSPPTRVLFNSLKFLHDQGEPLEFAHVLGELEDTRLKSLLVEIDESARAKAEVAADPADVRLNQLCDRLAQRRVERHRREAVAALEQGKLDYEKEKETLRQLFEIEKHRRGLTAPTEG